MKATGERGERRRCPLLTTLTLEEKFAIAVHSILKRYKEQAR